MAADLHRRLHFAEFLADAGFEVLDAPSCEAALERVRERRPRIVVSELIVPGAFGVSFPAKLREVSGDGNAFLIGLMPEVFYGSPDVLHGLGYDEVVHANVPAVMLARMVREVVRGLGGRAEP